MSNEKKVQTMIENGVAQLIILEGKAPEQLGNRLNIHKLWKLH